MRRAGGALRTYAFDATVECRERQHSEQRRRESSEASGAAQVFAVDFIV